nr:flagellar biosynthetic protein FliR [Rhodovulum imhoffii]
MVFLRVGGAMTMLPGFGERMVPLRIRLALSVAFTVVVAPLIQTELVGVPLTPATMAAEAVCGLALGLGLRFLVYALQMAGDFAAQSISLAQVLGSVALDPQPAMGRLMVVSGLAVAMMTGLHVRVVEIFALSYEILPPGLLPRSSELADWGMKRFAWAFGLAFSLAMPFVVGALLYNMALGIINKAMPQLMVAFVGAPALMLGGLILLFLSLPLILGVWQDLFVQTLSNPLSVPA